MSPVGPHDGRLTRLVAPPDWENPPPAGRYDLAVIGAGTAGLVASAVAAGLGARVALVERDRLGGDCLNTGCVPSKAILAAARLAADVRRGATFGIVATGVTIDFATVMERMRAVRAELALVDSAIRFRDLGVDVFFGAARFVGPDRLTVAGADLAFRRALLATGGRPRVPNVPGLDEAGFLTSETVFDLVERPVSLAVLGGGPIGCELAQAFARLGSRVTLVERESRLLPRDEPRAAEIAGRALAADGVELRLGAVVEGVAPEGAGARLVLRSAGGSAKILAERVLVAAGRVPNVDGLGLEVARVARAEDGVQVDARLRTTNRRIYAAGDVVGGPGFTHRSDAHARIAVRNALFPGHRRVGAAPIPWCTYMDPEVAHVGHTAASAREAGIETRAFAVELADLDRSVLEGEAEGYVEALVEDGGDTIVGVTIVSRGAGDLLGEACLAIGARVGLGRLSDVVHPYPTRAEAFRKAGDAFQRERLTPLAAAAIRRWLAWRR